jgi:hypothetical protein
MIGYPAKTIVRGDAYAKGPNAIPGCSQICHRKPPAYHIPPSTQYAHGTHVLAVPWAKLHLVEAECMEVQAPPARPIRSTPASITSPQATPRLQLTSPTDASHFPNVTSRRRRFGSYQPHHRDSPSIGMYSTQS